MKSLATLLLLCALALPAAAQTKKIRVLPRTNTVHDADLVIMDELVSGTNFKTWTMPWSNAVAAIVSNAIYTTSLNAAASNGVRIAAGSGATVATNSSGQRMVYTITVTGGGGGDQVWTNDGTIIFPPETGNFRLRSDGSLFTGTNAALNETDFNLFVPIRAVSYLASNGVIYWEGKVGIEDSPDNTSRSRLLFGGQVGENYTVNLAVEAGTNGLTSRSWELAAAGTNGTSTLTFYSDGSQFMQFAPDVPGGAGSTAYWFDTINPMTGNSLFALRVQNVEKFTVVGDGSWWSRGNGTNDGDLVVSGKITATGGVDPPYVLLDKQTHESVAARVAREVPKEKQGGAALFFNAATKRLEVYVADEGRFYDLAGKKLN